MPELPDSVPTVNQELSALRALPFDEFMDTLVQKLVHFTISLAIAVFVFYAGKYVIRKLHNIVAGILVRRKVDRSLSTFILSLIRIVLYFILIVTVIGILGINTSSFIALFASAGVAIGMALSGTLQNFAGGVLILLLKPYKVGDYIEAQGFAGTVTEIQIFSTIICTPDNKSIIIPNGGLSTGSINNWSREEYRRIDWTVSISYSDSVATAREAILAMLAEDNRVVQTTVAADREARLEIAKEAEEAAQTDAPEAEEPKKRGWVKRLFTRHHEAVRDRLDQLRDDDRLAVPTAFDESADRRPAVYVSSLAASSVDLAVRAWVRSTDYWAVYYHFNERFFTELPSKGVSFPFPQLDVHMIQPEGA